MKRKAFSAVLAVLLCFCLQCSAFAADTALTTVVPGSHQITVSYNDGGYVLYDGEVLPPESTLTVERFDDVLLPIICKPDSHVKSVTVNGVDVTEDLLYGRLVLEKVSDDLDVVITFEKCEDVPPLDPDDPNYDPENPDKPGDECNHIALSGGVYRDDDPFPGAHLEIDFGEITADADDEGKYAVEEIKDGYHTVTITDADGKPAGSADFAVVVSEAAKEVTVEKLPDGTQIVTVPADTQDILLDFIVHSDGTVEIVPGKLPEPEPTPTPGNPITENPVITKTGALIRENPLEAGILFAFGFFLLLFVILRRRKDDEEEETA